MSEKDLVAVKVGMRVHVFSPNRKEEWGLGTIKKVKELNFGAELIFDYPEVIELDDGRVTQGAECWWFPLEEREKIIKKYQK